jgi:hypothetical protein
VGAKKAKLEPKKTVDENLVLRWLGLAAYGKSRKMPFKEAFDFIQTVAYGANGRGKPKDVAFIAPSVGLHKRGGTVPLMIPGFIPTSEVVSRVAAGETPEAIGKAVRARRSDVENAIKFEKKFSGKGASAKPKPTKPAKPAKPSKVAKKTADPKVTRARAKLAAPDLAMRELIEQTARVATKKPRALKADVIKKLKLKDGRALPASLSTWLAFDTNLVECFSRGKLLASTVSELVNDFVGIEQDVAKMPGDAYVLQTASEQLHFLYAGEPDADGEYGVYCLDSREHDIALAAPGFDVWLAMMFERIPSRHVGDVPKSYVNLAKEHARLNLGGKKTLSIF